MADEGATTTAVGKPRYHFENVHLRVPSKDLTLDTESNVRVNSINPSDADDENYASRPGLSSGPRPADTVEHHDSQAQMIPVDQRHHLDTFSASALILNKMIGTGIFVSPAAVLAATDSKGISLLLWLAGCLITTAGQYVYLEYGIRWPVTGGELIYIHNVFYRPAFFFTYIFGMMFVVLGGTQANALTFGKEVIVATTLSGSHVDYRLQKFFAIILITFVCQLQAFSRIMNIRVHNLLAAFKVCLLFFVVVVGWLALGGIRTPAAARAFDTPYGVENLQHIFVKSRANPYSYAFALLNVVRAFLGYENANFVLDEVEKPPTDRMRTFRRALKLAVGLVCFLYCMVNIAFFAACTKDEILQNPETLALFFQKVFGPSNGAKRASAILLCLSAAGNVMALTFGYVRVKQEIARLGCVVFPEFFSGTSDRGTPAGALFLHWLFSVILVIACPLGKSDGFLAIATLYPYTHTWISILLGVGLLAAPWLKSFRHIDGTPWTPQSSRFGYWLLVPLVIIFILGNLFILVLNWWPADFQPSLNTGRITIPSYAGPIAGTAILGAGVLYWAWELHVLPWLGYHFYTQQTIDEDTGVIYVTYTRYLDFPIRSLVRVCLPKAKKVVKYLRGD